MDVGGNIDLYVKQDSNRSVRIEADENLMQYIEVKMEGDKLVIQHEGWVQSFRQQADQSICFIPGIYKNLKHPVPVILSGKIKLLQPNQCI